MSRAILYDSTMCVGCRECERACATRWSHPYDDKIASEEKISAHKFVAIQTRGDKYSRRSCMHCVEPTCASVCPVGAMQKTALGPVVYDETKCIGCRYCMQACPFQVPTYEWTARLPRVRKCSMCADRQAKGLLTACAEACPTGATKCGDRDELIAEAKKRLADKPAEYYQRIYGMQEVGGTSVLYIAAVPFDKIGLKTEVPQEPLPALTWRALSLVPDVAMVGSTLLGGVYWITHRRQKVAAEEAAEREAAKGGR